MTKSKGVAPAVQMAGRIQNAAEILSRSTAQLGGDYTEALVRIGMGEKRYADEIIELARIYASISNQTTDIVAPEGGKVHILRGIIVDESVDWITAIEAACPHTPANYDVRKIGDSYPAQKGATPVAQNIVLVNFGTYISNIDPVIVWGKKNKLPIASPRAVYATIKAHPTLHRELGIDPMVVVSPQECAFSGGRHVPDAWLYGDERRARLGWPDSSWRGRCWFAFVREEPLVA